ncbi:MAG: hypothetical protein LBU91_05660 [Bacteroidales bacterium]|jgi:hypothetical protein|nr:hypothetical protein [Bacteroidales bacterium]
MKKLFFYLVTMGTLFSACKKDSKFSYEPKKETVKKLPSKEMYNGRVLRTFDYDELNRLIRVDEPGIGNSWYNISYNNENAPIGLTSYFGTDTIVYQGDKVLIFNPNLAPPYLNDTTIITLNSKGEITLMRINGWQTSYPDKGTEYTYNSNGNLSRIFSREYNESITIMYSSVLSIFRHVNTPDWFILSWNRISDNYSYSQRGYMPAIILAPNPNFNNMYYTYELDSEGYGYVAKKILKDENGKELSFLTYEYIPAN